MDEPHSLVPTRTIGTPYSKLPGTWLGPQRRHLDVGFQFSTQCLVRFMLEKFISQNLQTILKSAVTFYNETHTNSSFNDFAKAEQENLQKSYYQFQEFSILHKLNFQSILSMKERVCPLLML